MAKRKVRVNELLRREISLILHTDYQSEGTYTTISEVDVSPDLRQARVYYSVLGGEEKEKEAERFFRAKASEIRQKISRNVILKYLPFFHFIRDNSLERGFGLIEAMDELNENHD
ncbi:MAG: 30S ribosome-binding factor RbfA [Verrucomicrobiota bacterium]